jgi:hypothetical protein
MNIDNIKEIPHKNATGHTNRSMGQTENNSKTHEYTTLKYKNKSPTANKTTNNEQ